MNNIYTLQCCTNVRILYVPYTVVISLRNITEIIISKLDSVRGCERVVQRVWNVYRGPCKLSRRRMIWLRPHTLPPPLPSGSWFSYSVFLCVASQAYRGEEEGGGGAKSYDDEKAWSSTNYSILSGVGEWQGVWRGTAVSLVNCVFGLV
jgi:hypothetical protein